MGLVGRLAGVLISANHAVSGKLRTIHARHTSTVGSRTRFTCTGEAVNIAGKKQSIVIGNNCVIAGQLLTFAHAGKISIGEWVFVGSSTHIWSSSEITIGNRVLISHNVEIHDTESHPLNPDARAAQTRAVFKEGHPLDIEGIRASPIWIGNDVWIGFGATIRRGVAIGDRAIIGAKAIVDRDVPEDGLVKAASSQEE